MVWAVWVVWAVRVVWVGVVAGRSGHAWVAGRSGHALEAIKYYYY